MRKVELKPTQNFEAGYSPAKFAVCLFDKCHSRVVLKKVSSNLSKTEQIGGEEERMFKKQEKQTQSSAN